jgi:hypothetical protein
MRTGWGVAVTVAVASAMLAPAGLATAEPIQAGNAYATVGNAPLNQCIVTSVRNPQEQTRTFWVGEGKKRRLITVVVSRSINVTLNCDV